MKIDLLTIKEHLILITSRLNGSLKTLYRRLKSSTRGTNLRQTENLPRKCLRRSKKIVTKIYNSENYVYCSKINAMCTKFFVTRVNRYEN